MFFPFHLKQNGKCGRLDNVEMAMLGWWQRIAALSGF